MPAPARPLAAFCTLLSPFMPLLFMGEEYGEDAPFQFFTDHIDKKIAEATREGRREEFAAFTSFAAEEIPDPQDPATFERSKLTRERDPELAALYARLLAARRRLPPGDADVDRVRRGRSAGCACAGARFELIATSAPSAGACRAAGRRWCSPRTVSRPSIDGAVELEPLSGALIA